MRRLFSVLRELLAGTYHCVDRVVLNAYYLIRWGRLAVGCRTWWRCLRGDDSALDDAHLRDMARNFSRRLHAFCVREAIPLAAAASERKHELAQPYLPNDPQMAISLPSPGILTFQMG